MNFILNHKKAWNLVAKYYKGGSALPAWGTSGEGSDIEILDDVKGKAVLEIGCGSGDSIIYLIKQGAGKVVGIDFSEEQIAIAKDRISKAFGSNSEVFERVILLNQSMDDPLPSEQFDLVVGIYSVGWAEDLDKLFKRVYGVLKPGGEFIFSWDHYLAHIVSKENGHVVLTENYHEPHKLVRHNWKDTGVDIETHQLRPSDWFGLLLESGFSVKGFWEPKPSENYRPLGIYSSVYDSEIIKKIPSCVIFKAQKGIK